MLSSSNIADYKYDIKRELWCEFTLQVRGSIYSWNLSIINQLFLHCHLKIEAHLTGYLVFEQFGLLNSKIDLTSLIEEHAKETVVHCVPGINRCLLKEVKGQQGPELHICTEGINILVRILSLLWDLFPSLVDTIILRRYLDISSSLTCHIKQQFLSQINTCMKDKKKILTQSDLNHTWDICYHTLN